MNRLGFASPQSVCVCVCVACAHAHMHVYVCLSNVHAHIDILLLGLNVEQILIFFFKIYIESVCTQILACHQRPDSHSIALLGHLHKLYNYMQILFFNSASNKSLTMKICGILLFFVLIIFMLLIPRLEFISCVFFRIPFMFFQIKNSALAPSKPFKYFS